MTRVNAGVKPKELPNILLVTEHREITRIPNAVSSGKAVIKNIPTEFCLGPGHVKFFYDKLLYLQKRYEVIFDTCMRRCLRVTYKGNAFDDLPEELMNDYIETAKDRKIIVERLLSRGYGLMS